MSQQIHLGAIVVREGRFLVFQQEGAEHWELPGGPLTHEHEDVDSGMETLLAERGISTVDIADAFIETVYVPRQDGHLIYNLYSAGNWSGNPSPPPAATESWVTPEEVSGLAMEDKIRQALLVAFGLREAVDDGTEIMKSMQGMLRDSDPKVATATRMNGRTGAGLDVLRTLGRGDPTVDAERLRGRYGELGRDVVDFALGEVWADDTIDRRTRSLMVVSMLAAMGRTGQMRSHIAGALNHGVTPEELVQTMRTVAIYAGFPAAMTAHSILNEMFEARGITLPEAGQ